MAKGAEGQAKQNIATGQAWGNNYNTAGNNINAGILPFLNQEVTNPQGFGTKGLNEINTAGGQATSGALSSAVEQAKLNAARTGNPNATSSIIDAATKSGMKQSSNNTLQTNLENLNLKQAQQQAGIAGESALGSEDINAALGSLGLSNNAVNSYASAENAANAPWEDVFNAVIGGASQVGAAALKH